jgi:hypothetical protein
MREDRPGEAKRAPKLARVGAFCPRMTKEGWLARRRVRGSGSERGFVK